MRYVRRMAKVFEKSIVISEAHLDSFGHLNNARYLELFEQARWDLITEGGFVSTRFPRNESVRSFSGSR